MKNDIPFGSGFPTNLDRWRRDFRAALERIEEPLVRLRVHDARCAVAYAHDPEDCTPRRKP